MILHVSYYFLFCLIGNCVALVVTSLVTGTVLNHFVKAVNAIQDDISSVKRDTSISVDSSGNLQIERTKKEEKVMGMGCNFTE